MYKETVINCYVHYLVHIVLIILFSLVLSCVENYQMHMPIMNIPPKSTAGKITIFYLSPQLEGLNKVHIANIIREFASLQHVGMQ